MKLFFQSLFYGIFLGLIIFLLIMLTVKRTEFMGILSYYHLLPEPERLTELYFEDHLHLPNSLISGKKDAFRFTVHNLEYQPIEYAYNVTYNTVAGTSGRITDGTIPLPHDGYRTVQVDFSDPETATRTAITVTLTNKDQSIHFWMDPPAQKH